MCSKGKISRKSMFKSRCFCSSSLLFSCIWERAADSVLHNLYLLIKFIVFIYFLYYFFLFMVWFRNLIAPVPDCQSSFYEEPGLLSCHILYPYTAPGVRRLSVLLWYLRKVRKAVKIRNRYNQVSNLTRDTTWESD